MFIFVYSDFARFFRTYFAHVILLSSDFCFIFFFIYKGHIGVRCRTYPLWYKLDGMISEYLDSVTLADLMQYPDAGNEYVI